MLLLRTTGLARLVKVFGAFFLKVAAFFGRSTLTAAFRAILEASAFACLRILPTSTFSEVGAFAFLGLVSFRTLACLGLASLGTLACLGLISFSCLGLISFA